MKRAVVTGGTGFVGANLARRLLRDGHEVHLLVRAQHQPWRIEAIREDVRLHVLDLSDEENTVAVLARIQPAWVFHLAAHGAYPGQTDARQMVETNVIQTMNLVRASVRCGVEAFVNTGSSSEYGYKDHPPSEDELPEPNSDYAVTKLAATMFCRFIAAQNGVPVPTLRLYSVYGPLEEPSRLIPQLIIRGLRGELPPLVSPDTARDFVYVEDVCEAYLLAAQTRTSEPGAIYNVCSSSQATLREIVGIARKTLSIAAEPAWASMPRRIWDTQTWVGDHRKLRAATGWQPRLTLEEGFAATARWIQEAPERIAFYNNASVSFA